MNRDWQNFKAIYGNIEGARAAFEPACEALFRKIYPNIYVSQVAVNQGDGGIDIVVGDYKIEPIIVIQCKFFLDSFDHSQKSQIKKSFKTAIESTEYELKEWILCIPRVFDTNQTEWWSQWKNEQIKIYNKTPDFIKLKNGNELIDLFHVHDLYNQYFKIKDSLKIEDSNKKITEIHKRLGLDKQGYAGLLAITPQFIEKEAKRHESQPRLYSSEQFYGAHPPVQWWGIIQGLVAERAIYAEIKTHIRTTLSKGITKPIITLILGSGGMGKSTFLRQLAIDLAADCAVFWLEDWKVFESANIAESLAEQSGYQLICLDNWHRLADEDKKAIKRWLEQHHNYHGKIKWLISDREEAKELSEFIYGKSCFDFDDITNVDKENDNKQLLEKVAEKIEDWKNTALELQHHAIAEAKPFHILFVLYRWAGQANKIDFDDFETTFHKIIEEDIDRLKRDKEVSGFAHALIDFACLFIQYKARLTQNTFLRLADYHNPGDKKNELFTNYQGSAPDEEAWGLLRYYLTKGVIVGEKFVAETFLEFSKEDLAEAIVQKFAKEFDRRKKSIFLFIVKDDSQFSASTLLQIATLNHVFNSQEAISFIQALLERGNYHPSYISLLTTKDSLLKFDNLEKHIEIIERFIAINPDQRIICNYLAILDKKTAQNKAKKLLAETKNQQVILKCFKILNKTPETIKKASELLAETKNEQVICKCFDILGKTPETIKKASKLLAETKDHQVICKCFDILDKTPETIKKASKLLEESNDYQVICKCFDILRNDAKGLAIKLLKQENQHTNVITKCFGILGKIEESQQEASKLLEESNNYQIICKCFDILGKTEESQQKAEKLLAETKDHQVICKCFDILGKSELTKEYAKEFIENSNNEQILARCVPILEIEAELFISKKLENWQSIKWLPLLQNCLYLANYDLQLKVINNIINDYQKNKSSLHFKRYQAILKIPLSNIASWQQETDKILINWKGNRRELVGASLIGNHLDLKKVYRPCLEILQNWEGEITYQKQKGFKQIYTFHIFKALAYPDNAVYKVTVQTTAQAMLDKETQEPGFLGDMLYQAAYNIVHHQQYPAWIPEANSPYEMQ